MFRAPLEAKGVDLAAVDDEVEDIVEYARTYLRINTESYKKIWYQLYKSPDATKWPNVLMIAQLLFSLPISTAKVERLFSILKAIKSERRTSLHCSTLNDLLEINVEGPPLASFSADEAIDLWWNACTGRRPNQKPRKEYRRRKSTTTNTDSDSSGSEPELALETLDSWFCDYEGASD